MRPADRETISTDHAPAAAGPYSQAIKAGRTIYLSGQLGVIPGVRQDQDRLHPKILLKDLHLLPEMHTQSSELIGYAAGRPRTLQPTT